MGYIFDSVKKTSFILTGMALFGLSSFISCESNAMNSERETITETNLDSNVKSEMCENLKSVLSNGIINRSVSATGDAGIRFMGVQQKDVIDEMLTLCAKLGTEKRNAHGFDIVHVLPSGLGTLKIEEIFSDGLYAILSINCGCADLPVREIRYIDQDIYRYNKNYALLP